MITQQTTEPQEHQKAKDTQSVKVRPNKQADFYGAGKFDAVMGAEPDPVLTENELYRRGYDDSFWQFYYKKYGIQIATEF